MYKVKKLYQEFGVSVEPTGGTRLSDLNIKEIDSLFRKEGVIVFSGFKSTPDEFEKFACNMPYNKFFGHTAKELREWVKPLGTTTKASKGTNRVYMHPELGYTPVLPDTCWFLCVQPSPIGGETLVCDGHAFLKIIPESILSKFREKGIRYVTDYPDGTWQALLMEDNKDAALKKLKKMDGVSDIKIDDKNTLRFNYYVPGIFKDRRNGLPVFNNSVMLAIQPDLKRDVFYGDGEKISPTVLEELDRLVMTISKPIKWGPGDVALLDNTRFLHGRNSFEGPRELHVKYGNAA